MGMDQYKFPCEPVANEDSSVTGPQYRFTILDDKVLRYEWAEDGVFEDRASTFAINRRFPRPEFRVEDTDDELNIITPSLHLTYDKKRFSPNGLVATFASKMTDWGSEWRYGEQLGGNLGGTARTLDGVDGRCDMGSGIISKDGCSVLDDSDSMLFDGQGFVTPRRPGERYDGYLFCFGYDYKGAMESFYAISGRQPIVPRWCLGTWWSRYHAYTQEEYLTLMDEFKAKNVPLSVAVIDVDWHWVKEDFVPHTGWTGYTWNQRLFPEQVAFAKALHDRGLKMTLNDHPHLGIAHHEEVYEELSRVLGHDTTHRNLIKFDPTSPKFMHAFFNVVHRKLEDQGCDFWWIDWQQGSHSRTPGFDPLWLLNHFQFLDTKQTHDESLPIIFSRYGGPGSHRYPVGFSGDSAATWDSLRFQPEFTATSSNIGYGWWSHDIGGHLPGYRDDECTARWVQYGTFSPILRLHSTVSRWMSKEPWLYRKECMFAMEGTMRLRHRLVPYIYSINVAPSILSLVQPLYWNFPTRAEAYQYPNEYYFGPSLVVAPIVTPRNKATNLAKTKAWVPPGRHVDIFNGTIYDGDREIDMYRSLEYIPVLAPEGSIIPLDQDLVPANGCPNPAAFEVIVVVGQDGQFEIFEDSRDDPVPELRDQATRSILIGFDQAAGRLTTVSAGKEWTFRFISTHIEPSHIRVSIDGSLKTDPHCRTDTSSGQPSTIVRIPAESNVIREITIDVGTNPQLDILDHSSTLSDILKDYQSEFHLKDSIWDIVQSKQSIAVKASRLLSLGLEEALYGPVAELLLADSRS
ncbi:glycoside hydrolase [Lophiotrema nucula]|uniref:Glycoside hydrolase n=1 Tax=Lophiotrema nucula TaxID=690887 RepID=A0A6A5YEQ7_9PLEO|nr:glycoside hydrolase [Lophiotrema nucula]